MFSVLSLNLLKMVTCANLANGSEIHSSGVHSEKALSPWVFEVVLIATEMRTTSSWSAFDNQVCPLDSQVEGY